MAKKSVVKPGSDNYEKKLVAFEAFNAKKAAADKKKPVKHAENQPHVAEQKIYNGNIVKGLHRYVDASDSELTANGDYYAYNGWVYLGDSPPAARKIYEEPITEYAKFYSDDYKPNFYQKFPREKIKASPSHLLGKLASASLLPGRQAEVRYFRQILNEVDKKKGQIGQTLPYSWEAHHILPMNCFINYFTVDEIKIILNSLYDINDGRNIIFLPELLDDTSVHKLPHHCSDHKKYNSKVEDGFSEVRDKIDEAGDAPEHEEAIEVKVEKHLHAMETQLFNYIKDFGESRLD